jgi:hypothetical protein
VPAWQACTAICHPPNRAAGVGECWRGERLWVRLRGGPVLVLLPRSSSQPTILSAQPTGTLPPCALGRQEWFLGYMHAPPLFILLPRMHGGVM